MGEFFLPPIHSARKGFPVPTVWLVSRKYFFGLQRQDLTQSKSPLLFLGMKSLLEEELILKYKSPQPINWTIEHLITTFLCRKRRIRTQLAFGQGLFVHSGQNLYRKSTIHRQYIGKVQHNTKSAKSELICVAST